LQDILNSAAAATTAVTPAASPMRSCQSHQLPRNPASQLKRHCNILSLPITRVRKFSDKNKLTAAHSYCDAKITSSNAP